MAADWSPDEGFTQVSEPAPAPAPAAAWSPDDGFTASSPPDTPQTPTTPQPKPVAGVQVMDAPQESGPEPTAPDTQVWSPDDGFGPSAPVSEAPIASDQGSYDGGGQTQVMQPIQQDRGIGGWFEDRVKDVQNWAGDVREGFDVAGRGIERIQQGDIGGGAAQVAGGLAEGIGTAIKPANDVINAAFWPLGRGGWQLANAAKDIGDQGEAAGQKVSLNPLDGTPLEGPTDALVRGNPLLGPIENFSRAAGALAATALTPTIEGAVRGQFVAPDIGAAQNQAQQAWANADGKLAGDYFDRQDRVVEVPLGVPVIGGIKTTIPERSGLNLASEIAPYMIPGFASGITNVGKSIAARGGIAGTAVGAPIAAYGKTVQAALEAPNKLVTAVAGGPKVGSLLTAGAFTGYLAATAIPKVEKFDEDGNKVFSYDPASIMGNDPSGIVLPLAAALGAAALWRGGGGATIAFDKALGAATGNALRGRVLTQVTDGTPVYVRDGGPSIDVGGGRPYSVPLEVVGVNQAKIPSGVRVAEPGEVIAKYSNIAQDRPLTAATRSIQGVEQVLADLARVSDNDPLQAGPLLRDFLSDPKSTALGGSNSADIQAARNILNRTVDRFVDVERHTTLGSQDARTDVINRLLLQSDGDGAQLGATLMQKAADTVVRELGIKNADWETSNIRRFAALTDQLKEDPVLAERLRAEMQRQNRGGTVVFKDSPEYQRLLGKFIDPDAAGSGRGVIERRVGTVLDQVEAAWTKVQQAAKNEGMVLRTPDALNPRLRGFGQNTFVDAMATSKAIMSPYLLSGAPRYFINNLIGDSINLAISTQGRAFGTPTEAAMRQRLANWGLASALDGQWASGGSIKNAMGQDVAPYRLPNQTGRVRAVEQAARDRAPRVMGAIDTVTLNRPLRAFGERVQDMAVLGEAYRRRMAITAETLPVVERNFALLVEQRARLNGATPEQARQLGRDAVQAVNTHGLSALQSGRFQIPGLDMTGIPREFQADIRKAWSDSRGNPAVFQQRVNTLLDDSLAVIRDTIENSPSTQAASLFGTIVDRTPYQVPASGKGVQNVPGRTTGTGQPGSRTNGVRNVAGDTIPNTMRQGVAAVDDVTNPKPPPPRRETGTYRPATEPGVLLPDEIAMPRPNEPIPLKTIRDVVADTRGTLYTVPADANAAPYRSVQTQLTQAMQDAQAAKQAAIDHVRSGNRGPQWSNERSRLESAARQAEQRVRVLQDTLRSMPEPKSYTDFELQSGAVVDPIAREMTVKVKGQEVRIGVTDAVAREYDRIGAAFPAAKARALQMELLGLDQTIKNGSLVTDGSGRIGYVERKNVRGKWIDEIVPIDQSMDAPAMGAVREARLIPGEGVTILGESPNFIKSRADLNIDDLGVLPQGPKNNAPANPDLQPRPWASRETPTPVDLDAIRADLAALGDVRVMSVNGAQVYEIGALAKMIGSYSSLGGPLNRLQGIPSSAGMDTGAMIKIRRAVAAMASEASEFNGGRAFRGNDAVRQVFERAVGEGDIATIEKTRTWARVMNRLADEYVVVPLPYPTTKTGRPNTKAERPYALVERERIPELQRILKEQGDLSYVRAVGETAGNTFRYGNAPEVPALPRAETAPRPVPSMPDPLTAQPRTGSDALALANQGTKDILTQTGSKPVAQASTPPAQATTTQPAVKPGQVSDVRASLDDVMARTMPTQLRMASAFDDLTRAIMDVPDAMRLGPEFPAQVRDAMRSDFFGDVKLKNVADAVQRLDDARSVHQQSIDTAVRDAGLQGKQIDPVQARSILDDIPDPVNPGWRLPDGTPYTDAAFPQGAQWLSRDGQPLTFTRSMAWAMDPVPDVVGRLTDVHDAVKGKITSSPAGIVPTDARYVKANELTDALKLAQQMATREGLSKSRAMLFGYDDRSQGQYLLDHWSPYSYWTVSHMLRTAQWLAPNPQAFAGMAIAIRQVAEMNKDQAPWDRFSVALFTMPDGTTVRLNPAQFFPYATQGVASMVAPDDESMAKNLLDVFGLSAHIPINLAMQWVQTHDPNNPYVSWYTGTKSGEKRARSLTPQTELVRLLSGGAIDIEGGKVFGVAVPSFRKAIYGADQPSSNATAATLELARRVFAGEMSEIDARRAILSWKDGKPNEVYQDATAAGLRDKSIGALIRFLGGPVTITGAESNRINGLYDQLGTIPKTDKKAAAALFDQNPDLSVYSSAGQNTSSDSLRRSIAIDEQPTYTGGTPEQQARWAEANKVFGDAYGKAIDAGRSTSQAAQEARAALQAEGLSYDDFQLGNYYENPERKRLLADAGGYAYSPSAPRYTDQGSVTPEALVKRDNAQSLYFQDSATLNARAREARVVAQYGADVWNAVKATALKSDGTRTFGGSSATPTTQNVSGSGAGGTGVRSGTGANRVVSGQGTGTRSTANSRTDWDRDPVATGIDGQSFTVRQFWQEQDLLRQRGQYNDAARQLAQNWDALIAAGVKLEGNKPTYRNDQQEAAFQQRAAILEQYGRLKDKNAEQAARFYSANKEQLDRLSATIAGKPYTPSTIFFSNSNQAGRTRGGGSVRPGPQPARVVTTQTPAKKEPEITQLQKEAGPGVINAMIKYGRGQGPLPARDNLLNLKRKFPLGLPPSASIEVWITVADRLLTAQAA